MSHPSPSHTRPHRLLLVHRVEQLFETPDLRQPLDSGALYGGLIVAELLYAASS